MVYRVTVSRTQCVPAQVSKTLPVGSFEDAQSFFQGICNGFYAKRWNWFRLFRVSGTGLEETKQLVGELDLRGAS